MFGVTFVAFFFALYMKTQMNLDFRMKVATNPDIFK